MVTYRRHEYPMKCWRTPSLLPEHAKLEHIPGGVQIGMFDPGDSKPCHPVFVRSLDEVRGLSDVRENPAQDGEGP